MRIITYETALPANPLPTTAQHSFNMGLHRVHCSVPDISWFFYDQPNCYGYIYDVHNGQRAYIFNEARLNDVYKLINDSKLNQQERHKVEICMVYSDDSGHQQFRCIEYLRLCAMYFENRTADQERQTQALQNENARLRQETAQLQAEIGRLTEETTLNQGLRATVTNLEQNIKQLRNDKTALTQEVTAKKAQYSALEQEQNLLRSQITEKDTTIQHLRRQLRQAKALKSAPTPPLFTPIQSLSTTTTSTSSYPPSSSSSSSSSSTSTKLPKRHIKVQHPTPSTETSERKRKRDKQAQLPGAVPSSPTQRSKRLHKSASSSSLVAPSVFQALPAIQWPSFIFINSSEMRSSLEPAFDQLKALGICLIKMTKTPNFDISCTNKQLTKIHTKLQSIMDHMMETENKNFDDEIVYLYQIKSLIALIKQLNHFNSFGINAVDITTFLEDIKGANAIKDFLLAEYIINRFPLDLSGGTADLPSLESSQRKMKDVTKPDGGKYQRRFAPILIIAKFKQHKGCIPLHTAQDIVVSALTNSPTLTRFDRLIYLWAVCSELQEKSCAISIEDGFCEWVTTEMTRCASEAEFFMLSDASTTSPLQTLSAR